MPAAGHSVPRILPQLPRTALRLSCGRMGVVADSSSGAGHPAGDHDNARVRDVRGGRGRGCGRRGARRRNRRAGHHLRGGLRRPAGLRAPARLPQPAERGTAQRHRRAQGTAGRRPGTGRRRLRRQDQTRRRGLVRALTGSRPGLRPRPAGGRRGDRRSYRRRDVTAEHRFPGREFAEPARGRRHSAKIDHVGVHRISAVNRRGEWTCSPSSSS
ncbi:hypothetical protein SCOCK_230140 [Actinacidiphila cocklensis]|uniref:Uncharacterized protein n=1 Tax=Actinacidiphila cocklensis TaxID=887465 RepID=A0A9W4GQW4_9ACTN|nr:hypothetical protein SCOCK_230140 [Actinacidiphila cocklensis]